MKLLKQASAFFGITGAILLALNIPLSSYGWLLFTLSSAGWVIASYVDGNQQEQLVQQSVFTAINIIGIYRWLM